MTATDYFKLMGISKATFYRRVNEAGLDLADIRDDNGQLTDEGLSILSALFDGTFQKRPMSQSRDADGDASQERSTNETVDVLRSQLETTRAELAAAQARITELLQQAADREREHAEAWRKYAEIQQQIEAQRLLTEGPKHKAGLFARIRATLTGKDKQTGETQ